MKIQTCTVIIHSPHTDVTFYDTSHYLMFNATKVRHNSDVQTRPKFSMRTSRFLSNAVQSDILNNI